MQFHEYGAEQEKDTSQILRSADAICRALPSARLHRLPGLRHGEFSINHADRYADTIRRIVCGGTEE